MRAQRLQLWQLEKMARAAGYVDYRDLLQSLYTVQELTLYELSRRCMISIPRLQGHMRRFNIPQRPKGRTRPPKVVFTPELLQEIARDGVPAVSRRLGVGSAALYLQMKSVKY